MQNEANLREKLLTTRPPPTALLKNNTLKVTHTKQKIPIQHEVEISV